VIIAVDSSFAQHLHVNPHEVAEQNLNDARAWSVHLIGDFMVVMNNQLAVPVIVRHPQRFNDSRSFIAGFKREFLRLMEAANLPHAKIRLIRDDQLATAQFTYLMTPAIAQQLKKCAEMLTGTGALINWDEQPNNTEIALQLADKLQVMDTQLEDTVPVMDMLEKYSLDKFHLPAHPVFNEQNRRYLYHDESLVDITSAVAVSQLFLADYQKYLAKRQRNDQVIDRDKDIATEYCSYCEARGLSPLDDLTLPYYYLLHYEEITEENISDAEAKAIVAALSDFGHFMHDQHFFTDEDFDNFIQAAGQGLEDRHSPQYLFRLQQLLHNMQEELTRQRQSLGRSRSMAKKRLRVRAVLKGYRPTMWREFEVGGDTRLDKLCFQVLASFGATGDHLFELHVGKNIYQLPVLNRGKQTGETLTAHWLGEFNPGDEFILEYDFGDSWTFTITVERVTAARPLQNTRHAYLLDGFGSGIIEDIGGTTGLMQAAEDDPTINHEIDLKEKQRQWGEQIARLQHRYE
jgi:hypothetical protein